MPSLSGRTALVTGAGNGLGLAIAHTLVSHGARVILCGRTETKLLQAAATLGAFDAASVRVATVDTASAHSVADLAADLVDERIDVLVNNAGIPGPVAPLWSIEPDDWDGVFAVNVRGIYLMCRAFLPQMIKRGSGDVINLASVSGKRPLTGRTAYAASKMAVIGLTATLAHEVGEYGINVNTLSPGPVAGPRMARNFALEAKRTGTTAGSAETALVSRAALGRMVTESEVAAAALAMLHMPGLSGADIDLSAGMIAR